MNVTVERKLLEEIKLALPNSAWHLLVNINKALDQASNLTKPYIKVSKTAINNSKNYNSYWLYVRSESGKVDSICIDRVVSEHGTKGAFAEYVDKLLGQSTESVTLEAAYQNIDKMNFGIAIKAMWDGKRVARKGWNGKGIFCELQAPDAHSKMTSPYIYINTTGLQTDNPNAAKSLVPWLASQADMLANDWQIV